MATLLRPALEIRTIIYELLPAVVQVENQPLQDFQMKGTPRWRRESQWVQAPTCGGA